MRWPTFLGGGFVSNPSEWATFDHREEALAYARVWPVPPSPKRPSGREFWFCPVGRGDRGDWTERAPDLLVDGGPRQGSAALPNELPGRIVVLERLYHGRRAYRPMAEYMPGHLYVSHAYRNLGLGAEAILAAAEHAGTGRPATAMSFTKGGFAAMRRGWLLGVERALASGLAVPSAVATDYAMVQRICDPTDLAFWNEWRPTPVIDPVSGRLVRD